MGRMSIVAGKQCRCAMGSVCGHHIVTLLQRSAVTGVAIGCNGIMFRSHYADILWFNAIGHLAQLDLDLANTSLDLATASRLTRHRYPPLIVAF